MHAALYIDITFDKGVATKINGKEFTEAGVQRVLGIIAKEYDLESSTILANAKKALSDLNGHICMKLLNGCATPFAA